MVALFCAVVGTVKRCVDCLHDLTSLTSFSFVSFLPVVQFPFCDGSHNDHNHNTRDNVGPLIIVDSRKRGKTTIPTREQIRNNCKKNNTSHSHGAEENRSSGKGGNVPKKKKEEIVYDDEDDDVELKNEQTVERNKQEDEDDVPSTVRLDPKTKKDQ